MSIMQMHKTLNQVFCQYGGKSSMLNVFTCCGHLLATEYNFISIVCLPGERFEIVKVLFSPSHCHASKVSSSNLYANRWVAPVEKLIVPKERVMSLFFHEVV